MVWSKNNSIVMVTVQIALDKALTAEEVRTVSLPYRATRITRTWIKREPHRESRNDEASSDLGRISSYQSQLQSNIS